MTDLQTAPTFLERLTDNVQRVADAFAALGRAVVVAARRAWDLTRAAFPFLRRLRPGQAPDVAAVRRASALTRSQRIARRADRRRQLRMLRVGA